MTAESIPWRTATASAAIEVIEAVDAIRWRVGASLGAEYVDVVFRDDAGQAFAFRDGRMEGAYPLPANLELLGVRAVRGGRLGPLHRPDAESQEQSLSSGRVWGGLSPLALERLRHALDPEWQKAPTLWSDDPASWTVQSLDMVMAPLAPGLSGEVTVQLVAPGGSERIVLQHMPGEASDLTVSPEHMAATVDGRALTVDFGEAPESGQVVEIHFSFDTADVSDLGVDPVNAASEPDLFFFSPRGPLVPAPEGQLTAAMPLSLDLVVPEGWWVASNLVQSEAAGEVRLEGAPPRPGRPAVAAGAFARAADVFDATAVEALARVGEDGVGDLEDYVASFIEAMTVFERWGSLPQESVSVAAVSPGHGGSAHFGLVLVPDFIFHRDRTRARDFFLTHELSHQWWGTVVRHASTLDLWLTEGLADYAALRAIEVLRGEADAGEVWEENLELLIHLMAEGYGDQPGRDVPVRPSRTADLQDYVYYLKGSWVLRHLEALVGRSVLDDALAAYYGAAIHATASTDDFIAAVEAEAGRSLTWFWRQWLSGTGLPEVVHTVYVDPDDADDFEVVVSQIGDRPFADESWRLPVYVTVGERAGWVCLHDRQQSLQAGDLRTEGPLGLCDP